MTMLGRSYAAAVTSDPSAKTTQGADQHRHPAAQVGDPPDQRQHRDVAEQEPGDDRSGALQLVDAEPDARHHVRQREDDDVGVGGGERDRDRGQPEQEPRPRVGTPGAGHRRRSSRRGDLLRVPYSSNVTV